MSRELDEVRGLKADAKTATAEGDSENRDGDVEAAAGAWQSAIADLEEAIALLSGLISDASIRLEVDLYSELADCYGMIGGVERRWALASVEVLREGHLSAAVRAYDKGFEYEDELVAGEATTYNRINRLSTRVLLDPNVLEGADYLGVSVPAELLKSEEILSEQLASVRQRDPWGYCDLGTVRLMLGSPEALPTLREVDRLRAPKFVYQSVLGTLRPLAAVASDLRPDLMRAVSQLERSEQYAPES
jgi:hypothetical protein